MVNLNRHRVVSLTDYYSEDQAVRQSDQQNRAIQKRIVATIVLLKFGINW